jgi:hypothetical protein
VGAADDGADIWEISPRVPLPGALERDTLVRASGAAGLELLTGHRWAEPLRDAVPRLLLHDLAQLRGGARVWAAPAPPGVAVARRLRVELLALQAAADGRSLNLQAQWWLQETGTPASPPRKGQLTLQLPLADAGVDTLAAAHRLALWRLAVQIARTAATAPP